MISRLKTLLTKMKDRAILNAIPVAVLAAVVAGLYLTGSVVETGVGTYLASLPALAIIAITALARVNDIGTEKTGWTWQLRRIGLTLVGTAAVVLAYAPIVDHEVAPSWRGLALYYGFALTWITTPNMPPWWRYVSGEMKPKTTGD